MNNNEKLNIHYLKSTRKTKMTWKHKQPMAVCWQNNAYGQQHLNLEWGFAKALQYRYTKTAGFRHTKYLPTLAWYYH